MVEEGLRDADLPDVLDVIPEDFDELFEEWFVWIALGRKFLPEPGGFEAQSHRKMEFFFKIDGVYEKILSDALEQKRKEQETSD